MSKHKGWHPEDIKAAIRKKGVPMSQLSLQWGFSETAVRTATRIPSPQVDQLIARYIGVSMHELWPDRYDENNIRIFPKRPPRLLTKKRARVSQKNTPLSGAVQEAGA